ncbi:uncharacterized protein DNG_09384 [Cephalotrichum gorgonifer]|uniref:NmrA-like domain-containing protein n=1 Tax=Cephalotrichum gorgonifer TaxID=2041049 RepID=A0AAE8SZ90_9PEZI|nr:uncharacterized protein DNG_09384 [Cephalotrichum gorgonifer]
MSPKIVTVQGAVGNQGNSVALSLLASKTSEFKVRAITRSPDSERAKALEALGAEVVRANSKVKEELVAAFTGSWAAFVNTNTDDPEIGVPGAPTELDIGKIAVDAAAEAGVKVFVYSGMESVEKMTGGKMSSKNFEEKYGVAEYAKTKGFESVINLSPGMYMENFLVSELAPVFGGFPVAPDEEGILNYVHPRWGGNEEQPMIGIEADYGDLVHGILLNPAKYNNRLVQAISESRSAEDTAKDFQEVTGKKARYVVLENVDDFPTFGMRALETVREIYQFCQIDGGLYYGVPNDVDTAAELKAAAAKAQGKEGEDAKLMTMKKFFKAHFPS